jgi:hypothetical protein
MARPSSVDLILSVIHSPSVLLLKPNRASSRNCDHHAKGRLGSPSTIIVPTRNSAPLHAAPGARPLNFAHHHGSRPLKSTAPSTTTSHIVSNELKRLFASV